MTDARIVAALADKEAVRELMYRRCRASDRCDTELALSCYHEDAVEIHPGYNSRGAREFILEHSEMAKGEQSTTYMMYHALLNMLIDLDSDRAFVETYHIAISRSRDERGDMEFRVGGRFLDDVERRGNAWRISRREIVMDWSWVLPVGEQFWDMLPSQGGTMRGVRGGGDPLYRHVGRGPPA